MSFSLVLPFTRPTDLVPWAERHGFHRAGALLVYETPVTGVTFSLALEPTLARAEIPYNCPSYVAVESLEVLGALCAVHGLGVVDLQRGNDRVAFDPEALLASWQTGNAAALRVLADLGIATKPSMPRTDAMAAWTYLRARSQICTRLAEQLDEEPLVPDLVVVNHKGRALRLAFLPDPTWYVLPPVDVVIFKRGNARCATGAERIRKGLAKVFVPLANHPETRVTNHRLYDHMETWYSLLGRVQLDFAVEDLERIGLDGFVDA
jgi:hypothetical protein